MCWLWFRPYTGAIMGKPVVAVIFGSRSTEHDVSIVTALASVVRPLRATGDYEVLPVYVAKDGRWYAGAPLGDIELFSSGKITDWLRRHRPVRLEVGDGLRLAWPGLRPRTVAVDVVFPALHGTNGEDGALMGLLEMAGVPYVGCGVAASAIAMDKVLTKQVCQTQAIAVTPYVDFVKHEYEADPDEYVTRINRTLHYPLFVKPAHLGSSIGITKVNGPEELANAIEVALHYDDRALVEQAVTDLTEVTLPVMGNESPRPALLEQPLVGSDDFFDFDTKYMHGGKKGKSGIGGGKPLTGGAKGEAGAQGYSRLPADLEPTLYAKAEATGLAVYRALGCSGIARVDMLIDNASGEVYCNEVNPLPGSLYQHNWNRAGVSSVKLVAGLVSLAKERQASRSGMDMVFNTNFLKQF